MKKYESTITKHILENPILLPDNFLKIFNEFEIEEKNKNNNPNNQNNKQNNINFTQNYNNNQNDEKFISFRKNLINNGDLSPILSSDSQKNKFSSSSSDKYQVNFPSPIPKGKTIIPIIKNANKINNSEKIEIPPLFPKNNEIILEVPYKEIKFINQDKNKKSENNWKKIKESLILQKLLENKINNINNNKNLLNLIPKNVIVKLLIFSIKNDLFNENNQNMNNINHNDISTDVKISNEPTTKIEASTKIILTNNSIDEIADNSNLYYIDKENYEEQPHQYEPTNIQKILDTNLDTILDNNKFESAIKELSLISQSNEKFEQEKENDEYNNNNINSTSKVYIYPIKEVDEDKYEHESKNPSMRNFSFGNNLNLNNAKESNENLNNLNLKKEIKAEKPTLNPFLANNNNLDNEYKNKKDSDKEKKIEIKDFSEFFKPQQRNLNNIELKINNLDNTNNDNINDNNKENKKEFLFGHILNKQKLKNSEDNNNNKDSFNILFNEPYTNFSFGKSDFNNNIKKTESKNEKNDSNPNSNKEIENNIIVTFDKKKNQRENEKNINITEFDNNKNCQKNDMAHDKNKIENLETKKLIDNKDNNNININDKDNNEIDLQFFSFRPNILKLDENEESKKVNNNNKEEKLVSKFTSEKKNENEIDNLNKENEIKITSTENLIEKNNNKNEENIKYNNNDNNANNEKEEEKKEELIIKIVKDDIIDNKKNNINPDENKINNSIKLSNNEDNTNTNSYKDKENNKKIIEEKIILNNSDCKDENPSKKIDFNRYINSPEVFSSFKSKSININNDISIRTNLFNIKPKVITNLQMKNIQKLYPKFNKVINSKNINKDFLKYFLNDFNCIIFTSDINNSNKNKYKIKLKSYFNILKKMNEKTFYFHDSLVEILINSTYEQINLIKQKNNIKEIPLLSNSYNIDIKNEKSTKAMKKVFSKLNSKLKDMKDYYQNINNKNKINNNIANLRDEFKQAFRKVIGHINNKYKNSPIIQIKFYLKVIDDVKLFCVKENNIPKKNTSKIKKKVGNSNSKKENKLFIQNPLFIVGIIFPIVCFLIKFFY